MAPASGKGFSMTGMRPSSSGGMSEALFLAFRGRAGSVAANLRDFVVDLLHQRRIDLRRILVSDRLRLLAEPLNLGRRKLGDLQTFGLQFRDRVRRLLPRNLALIVARLGSGILDQ